MRGAWAALLACVSIMAGAAAPVTPPPAESVGLRSIAGWLKSRGTPGFLAAEVADAVGIPRGGSDTLDAMQRGFRDADVLRVAQSIEGGYLLFMVQAQGEVYFYLSTVQGGLRKALVSVPSRRFVVPLEATEAETNFRREVLYWEDRTAE
ncbi:MAG TPA: hypothetical protein VIV54_16710 [Burkholderiales bacterium]